MKMPLVRAALVVSAAALLVPAGALAAPAGAATLSIGDATGDTYLGHYDEASDTTTYEPAGWQVNVDLEKVVVKHKGRVVVAKASYTDLVRSGQQFMYALRLRTNEGLKRDVNVDTMFTGPKGEVSLSRPNGNEVTCRGLSHDIDYAADTVTVRVPRSCLSAPRWVQVFTAAIGFSDTGDFYIDHGHMADMKEKVVWSDRIRKG
ncbi:MAG: hypothetical protein ACTHKG_16425 [Nocardioides sp.]